MLDVILVGVLIVTAVATVVTARTLRSVIGLAGTSVAVALLMFRLEAPIAAVFELSVCAGLIPAIFLSTIGLTRRLTPETLAERWRQKVRMYWALPVILGVIGVTLLVVCPPLSVPALPPSSDTDVRQVLWNLRHMDLLGQMAALLGAMFAVVVLMGRSKDAQ